MQTTITRHIRTQNLLVIYLTKTRIHGKNSIKNIALQIGKI